VFQRVPHAVDFPAALLLTVVIAVGLRGPAVLAEKAIVAADLVPHYLTVTFAGSPFADNARPGAPVGSNVVGIALAAAIPLQVPHTTNAGVPALAADKGPAALAVTRISDRLPILATPVARLLPAAYAVLSGKVC